MLAIIPLVCFTLIALVVAEVERGQRASDGWRHVFLCAAVAWGALVTMFTEALSSAGLLATAWVSLCWVVATAGGAVLYTRLRLERHSAPPQALSRSVIRSWWVYGCAVGVIMAVTAVLAIIAPPNNWDAMTYHLARVMHWAQDASVAFYPTSIQRQLFDPPWAEYASLHLYLLTGNDYLTNCIQWFSFVGSCLGVSLIARQLGAGFRGQGLAALFAATIPMGILQASSPQNDYVTTFWVICLAYFLLCYRQTRSRTALLAGGGSLGLALLTKGTAYVYAVPLLLWFGIWSAGALGRWGAEAGNRVSPLGRVPALASRVWKPWLIIGIPALALNVPQYVRNLALFGSPLGPDSSLYANATHAPGALLCTAVRNVTLEFATPYDAVNSALYHATVTLCGALGSSASDPRTTWASLPFRINSITNYEGTVGNPIHFVLLVAVFGICAGLPSLRRQPLLLAYVVTVAGTFVLFCSSLRWEPWGNRLMLPLFLLAAPAVGVVLERLAHAALRRQADLGVRVLACALFVAAIPPLLANENAPIIGPVTLWNTPRTEMYFVSFYPGQSVDSTYERAAHQIEQAGCHDVGLTSVEEGWEYPLWLMFRNDGWQASIQYVNLTNASGRLSNSPPFSSFQPCAILTIGTTPTGALESGGVTFARTWSEQQLTLYLRQ